MSFYLCWPLLPQLSPSLGQAAEAGPAKGERERRREERKMGKGEGG